VQYRFEFSFGHHWPLGKRVSSRIVGAGSGPSTMRFDFTESGHSAACHPWEGQSPTAISLAHLWRLARGVSRAIWTARREAERTRRVVGI